MENSQTQSERLRVLKMLEEGKLNAEECAELLDALSLKMPGASPHRRTLASLLILAGAVLVLAGFLLPWFGSNFSQAQGTLDESKLGMAEVLMIKLSPVVPYEEIMRQMMTESRKIELHQITESQFRLSFSGYMLKHGLGWAILGLSLAATVISLALTGTRGVIQRNAALCLLALGSFMIFYLVFQIWRLAEFGLAVVLVGYVLETAGVLILPPRPSR